MASINCVVTVDDTILIEHYLKNLLSNEEQTQFEERLKPEDAFNNEHLLEKQLKFALNEE